MSFETLSHTPEFELPVNAPSAPADLISLVEECHEGLARAIVSKMIRRGKYDQIATITCQENPSKKSHPPARADDIAEYCMMCMQYEAEKSDDPGTYKVTLYGPPGKGRFERSKHIDLSDGDGEAHSKTMLSEGDLLEQQQNYIGELHSQMIAMHETLQGMVKPLMQENKEMMKIVSESQRRLADVEAQRLRHELELKIHADEVRTQEQEQEHKMERWRELLGVVKDTGAFEAILKAVVAKMKAGKDATKKTDKKSKEDEKQKSKKEDKKESKKEDKKEEKTAALESTKKDESKIEKAKKKKKAKTKKKKKLKTKPLPSHKEITQQELEEAFKEEGMRKAIESPLLITIEMLKMTIDNNNQWPIVETTLSKEQFVLFKEIIECGEEKLAEKKLKELYQMKGMRRFMQLEEHLDEEQQKFVDMLLEVAAS